MAHPNPGSAVSMWQANMLDVNPRTVPAFVLGQLLSCSPASAGGGPVHCRGLVSFLQGACDVVPRRLGTALGGVAVGRQSVASCCCREVAVGPGPGGLADVSPYRCGVCPPWGPQGLDSLSLLPAVQSTPAAVLLWEKNLPHWKGFGQGVLHSVSKWLFQARTSVADALAGAGHRLCHWRRRWALLAEPCWVSSHFSWLLSGHRLTLTGSRSSWQ